MLNIDPSLIILITGANGTIGCDLVYHFSKTNKVLAFYRTDNSFSENFKSKNVTWIKQDLRNIIECKIVPDVIIHGVVTHPFANKNSNLDYINSNIISLLNIIDYANEKKVSHFIYLSSVKIYGDINTEILNDDNFFKNPDLLGATKILSEALFKNQNFKFLCLRLPGVLCYENSPDERPWLNSVISKLKNDQDVTINNKDVFFNNIIDTIEIFNFIQYILKNDVPFNISFNFSASSPIRLEGLILGIKKYFNSKSDINFSKVPTNHFIISNEAFTNNFDYEVSTTQKIVKRYLKSIN